MVAKEQDERDKYNDRLDDFNNRLNAFDRGIRKIREDIDSLVSEQRHMFSKFESLSALTSKLKDIFEKRFSEKLISLQDIINTRLKFYKFSYLYVLVIFGAVIFFAFYFKMNDLDLKQDVHSQAAFTKNEVLSIQEDMVRNLRGDIVQYKESIELKMQEQRVIIDKMQENIDQIMKENSDLKQQLQEKGKALSLLKSKVDGLENTAKNVQKPN